MGLTVRITVNLVCHKMQLKTAYLDTQTCQNIEINSDSFQKAKTKGADQSRVSQILVKEKMNS